MSKERPSRKLSANAITKATGLFVTFQNAKGNLEQYLDGVKEGMGLQGDYNLDTNDWTFKPVEQKPPQEKKEA